MTSRTQFFHLSAEKKRRDKKKAMLGEKRNVITFSLNAMQTVTGAFVFMLLFPIFSPHLRYFPLVNDTMRHLILLIISKMVFTKQTFGFFAV